MQKCINANKYKYQKIAMPQTKHAETDQRQNIPMPTKKCQKAQCEKLKMQRNPNVKKYKCHSIQIQIGICRKITNANIYKCEKTSMPKYTIPKKYKYQKIHAKIYQCKKSNNVNATHAKKYK